jgi:splicing factor 3B subunit 3
VLALEKLSSVFHQSTVPLQFTGRKLVLDQEHALAFISEGDQGCLTEKAKQGVLVGARLPHRR